MSACLIEQNLHSNSALVRIPGPVLTRGGKPCGLKEIAELDTLVPAAVNEVD